MKYIHLLSCSLIATLSLNGMDALIAKIAPTNPWQEINCVTTQQALQSDYNNHVKDCLLEYKKIGFTPEKMDTLKNMSLACTGNDQLFPIFKARDEENNYFTHIAVQKFDLPMVQWLMNQTTFTNYPYNKAKKGCIEICIDHLSPTNSICYDNISYDQKNTAFAMLDVMTKRYENNLSIFLRKPIVEKLITLRINLQEAHRYADAVALKNDFITRFLTQANGKAPLDLKTLYQTVNIPETGNTLSHAIVENHDDNALYELIKNDHVSPSKNKIGLTVLDLALKCFQEYTQQPQQFETQPADAARARCCYFMLLKYILTIKQNKAYDYKECCDKHPITADVIKG